MCVELDTRLTELKRFWRDTLVGTRTGVPTLLNARYVLSLRLYEAYIEDLRECLDRASLKMEYLKLNLQEQ